MPNLVYRFAATNQDSVIRPLVRIREEAEAAARAQKLLRANDRSAGAGSSRSPARREEQLARQAERDQLRVARRASTEAARQHAKSEREKTNATRKEVRERAKIESDEGKRLAKFLSDKAKNDHREQIKQAREVASIRKREARNLAHEQAAAHRQAKHQFRRETRESRQSTSRTSGMLMGAGMGLAATAAGLGMAAGGALYDVGDAAVRRRMGLEDQASRLAVSGRESGKRAVNTTELVRESELTAGRVPGANASGILSGMQRYVAATGNLDEARKFSKTFATTSVATGASVEDIAATAAVMRNKFQVTSESEMQDALAKLIQQGKSAEFEMSDMAQYYTAMGAAGSRFGLDKGTKGVQTLGGLAQISRMSTGSGAEAATGVQAMLRQIVSKGGKGKEDIKALTGFDIWEKGQEGVKTKSIEDVLAGVIGGAKGNQTALTKIFGDEGMKGVSALIVAYNEAQMALGKGAKETDKRAAGEKALREMLEKNIGVSASWGDVVKDASIVQDNASTKLESAGEKILSAFGKELQPGMQMFLKNLDVLVKPAGEFAKSVGLASQALGTMVRFLQRAGILDAPKSEQLSTSGAAKKLAADDLRLIELNRNEKRYGGLTPEEATERAEINDRAPGLIQAMAPAIEDEYDQKFGVGHGAPMWRDDVVPEIGAFARKTRYYRHAVADNAENPIMDPKDSDTPLGDFIASRGALSQMLGSQNLMPFAMIGDGMLQSNNEGRGQQFRETSANDGGAAPNVQLTGVKEEFSPLVTATSNLVEATRNIGAANPSAPTAPGQPNRGTLVR